MLDLSLELIWLIFYFQSPHLFPILSILLYTFNWDPWNLSLLVAFPISPIIILKSLQKQERPESNFHLEFIRWFFVLFFPEFGRSLMICHCYDTAFLILGELLKRTILRLSHLKKR